MTKNIPVILFLILLWIYQPIAYQNVAHNKILTLRAGGANLDYKSRQIIARELIREKFLPDFPERVSYEKKQNSKPPPNIFDTRKSLLEKLRDREVRTNFIDSYKNRFMNDN